MEESELKNRREPELNGFLTSEIRFRPKARSYGGYTSLKDLLPSSAETAALIASSSSPAASSSWNEIPIRNHLVKHAAMAYLQPMSAQAAPNGKSVFARLRDACCGAGDGDGENLGCASWLSDAVSRVCSGLFGSGNSDDEEDDGEPENDDTEIDNVIKLGEN